MLMSLRSELELERGIVSKYLFSNLYHFSSYCAYMVDNPKFIYIYFLDFWIQFLLFCFYLFEKKKKRNISVDFVKLYLLVVLLILT